MVGVLAALALLLAVAGAGKMIRPGPASRALRAARLPGGSVLASTPIVRVTGLAEVAVATLVLVWGGPLSAALLSASYLLLTVVAWRMLTITPGQDCGCFGRTAEPISRWHVVVDAAGFLVGATAVFWPQPSAITELISQGAWGGVALATLTLLLAWLCYLMMTALPALLDLGKGVTAPR